MRECPTHQRKSARFGDEGGLKRDRGLRGVPHHVTAAVEPGIVSQVHVTTVPTQQYAEKVELWSGVHVHQVVVNIARVRAQRFDATEWDRVLLPANSGYQPASIHLVSGGKESRAGKAAARVIEGDGVSP